MKLENKVAIITGGTKGIGYGIAEEYLKEGAKITICSRNAQEGVKRAGKAGRGVVPAGRRFIHRG